MAIAFDAAEAAVPPGDAPVAAVFPDAETLVGDYLAARPELTGVPVGPVLPAGNDGTQPAVVLIRDGGSYREYAVLDEAQIRIETYGPGPTAAQELMRRVRALLAGLPETSIPGSVVTDVTEEVGLRGLRRITDRNQPERTRYALNVRLLIRLQ